MVSMLKNAWKAGDILENESYRFHLTCDFDPSSPGSVLESRTFIKNTNDWKENHNIVPERISSDIMVNKVGVDESLVIEPPTPTPYQMMVAQENATPEEANLLREVEEFMPVEEPVNEEITPEPEEVVDPAYVYVPPKAEEPEEEVIEAEPVEERVSAVIGSPNLDEEYIVGTMMSFVENNDKVTLKKAVAYMNDTGIMDEESAKDFLLECDKFEFSGPAKWMKIKEDNVVSSEPMELDNSNSKVKVRLDSSDLPKFIDIEELADALIICLVKRLESAVNE